MVVKFYVPSRGDIVWTNFSPQSGREQKGKRPAIILSSKKYNGKTGLALMCPITSKIKGYPFEVPYNSEEISGAILSDHIKNLDWRTRKIIFISKAEKETVNNVIKLVGGLLTQ